VSFIGNILAYTSISCSARVTVNGRLLATNGAVSLIQDVVSYPEGPTAPTSHPTLSPSVNPSMALSSFPTTPFAKKSDSNGISRSNVILASVLGSIGGLIVVGLIVGAAVYLVSTMSSSSGGSVPAPEKDIPLQDFNALVPGSEEAV
jgi:hypothetical protein